MKTGCQRILEDSFRQHFWRPSRPAIAVGRWEHWHPEKSSDSRSSRNHGQLAAKSGQESGYRDIIQWSSNKILKENRNKPTEGTRMWSVLGTCIITTRKCISFPSFKKWEGQHLYLLWGAEWQEIWCSWSTRSCQRRASVAWKHSGTEPAAPPLHVEPNHPDPITANAKTMWQSPLM